MSAYLFSYGTLQPGLAPDEIAPLVAKMSPIGTGFVHGVLYDFGQYPGAILDPDSPQKVFGTLLRLEPGSNTLGELDAYEEFDPESPQTSQFVRTLHPVTLTSGGTLLCWVYVYNRDPADMPLLESGLFTRKAS